MFSAIGMYFDAVRLIRLSRIAGESIGMSAALRVVFGNYFAALLTPGAAGGAVIQVLFLRKAGMPTGRATIVVLMRTILSILFLILCLPLVFYYDPQILPWFERGGMIRSSLFLIGLIVLTFLTLRTRVADRLVVFTVKRLPFRWRYTLIKIYRDMRSALTMMGREPASILLALGESALSLLALYAMVPVLAFGLGAKWAGLQIMGRMIFLNLLLYFAPTPGGTGIAEGLFINSFSGLFPDGTVGVAAVVWRFFAEYLPACAGGYFTWKTFGSSAARPHSVMREGNRE